MRPKDNVLVVVAVFGGRRMRKILRIKVYQLWKHLKRGVGVETCFGGAFLHATGRLSVKLMVATSSQYVHVCIK